MADLSDFTSLHVGGPARNFVEVGTEAEIIAAIESAGDSPILIIGGGTNMLVSRRAARARGPRRDFMAWLGRYRLHGGSRQPGGAHGVLLPRAEVSGHQHRAHDRPVTRFLGGVRGVAARRRTDRAHRGRRGADPCGRADHQPAGAPPDRYRQLTEVKGRGGQGC